MTDSTTTGDSRPHRRSETDSLPKGIGDRNAEGKARASSVGSETDSLPKGIGDFHDEGTPGGLVIAWSETDSLPKGIGDHAAIWSSFCAGPSETDSLPKGIGDVMVLPPGLPWSSRVRNGLTAERHW